MKKIIFFLLFLNLFTFLYSEPLHINNTNIKLSGKVIDINDNDILSGVKIRLINKSTNVTYNVFTDLNGVYNFNNIESGDYEMIIEYISYNKTSNIIYISNNKEIDIKISKL